MNVADLTNQIIDRAAEAIETITGSGNDNVIVFSDDLRQCIHNVAQMCRNHPVYRVLSDRLKESDLDDYLLDVTPEIVFYDMLFKIIHAPTVFHRFSVIVMLFPTMDELLSEVTEHAE